MVGVEWKSRNVGGKAGDMEDKLGGMGYTMRRVGDALGCAESKLRVVGNNWDVGQVLGGVGYELGSKLGCLG